jgi:hypothetical protein
VQEEMHEALESRSREHQEVLSESKVNLERQREEKCRAQDMLQYDGRYLERKHDKDIQSLKMGLEINEDELAERETAVMRWEMQIQAEAQRLEDKLHFEGIVAQIRANSEKRCVLKTAMQWREESRSLRARKRTMGRASSF